MEVVILLFFSSTFARCFNDYWVPENCDLFSRPGEVESEDQSTTWARCGDWVLLFSGKTAYFTEVKRGDIYMDSSGVCYSWRLCSNGKDDTEAAVHHAKLNIVGSFVQKKFTVKTYRGRNAMEEWRRDFLWCSADWCRALLTLVDIFVPELIPMAHIRFDAGLPKVLEEEYLSALSMTLGCSEDEIWMDPVKGKFCRGPARPASTSWPIHSHLLLQTWNFSKKVSLSAIWPA
ncbi:hypothetical protein L218DRAFT_1067206 [Marasmius fiardii PR-910]|nr:hypothetical protein L218DRAFT_1067206 [Marasmius fiardii PR-910]